MDSNQECKTTTKEPIQNTLQQGSEQNKSEKPINKRQTASEQKTGHVVGKSNRYFTLMDLSRLTFSLDGEQVLNVQDATSEQFWTLANALANVTNVEEWYLEDRRDFVNQMHTFCEANSYQFPFTFVEEVVDEAATEAAGA
jgi:hypothetical protein